MKCAEFPPPHLFSNGLPRLCDFSRSINHISLHVDVKERTLVFCRVETNRVFIRNRFCRTRGLAGRVPCRAGDGAERGMAGQGWWA